MNLKIHQHGSIANQTRQKKGSVNSRQGSETQPMKAAKRKKIIKKK